jgi:ABC-type sugar transport system permease subunit
MNRKRTLKAGRIRKIEGSLFIAPWVIGFMVFMAFPLGYSLYMSFHNVRIIAAGIEHDYVGLKYYKTILFEHGGILYNQLLPFMQQVFIMIPIIVVFSLLIAIMLNQQFPGRTFFRIIFFLPVIFATGEVVKEFIAQGEGELGFLARYNFEGMVTMYLSATWAKPILSILNSFVLILWYSGVQILIFLAGRQTISNSVYEAARIDGSGPWETFWKITLPGMTPFILLNLIYTVVDLFTFPTNPVIAHMKVNNTQYGMSSAVAWVYFSIILLFLAIVFVVFGRMTRAAKVLR